MLPHRQDPHFARRIAAAGIALIAWTGLAIQWFAIVNGGTSALLALWIMSAYFTISTNLLVAVVFTAIALDRSMLGQAWVVAGTMLSILLVGVIYALVLHGTVELSGGSAIANVITHMVVPAAVPLFWLLFTQKGSLAWRDPLLWAVYPLAYLVVSLIRGTLTRKYPYPFLDVSALAWPRVAVNAALIAIAFMLAGSATVWIDRWFAARSRKLLRK